MTDRSGKIACVLIANCDALVICLSEKRRNLRSTLCVDRSELCDFSRKSLDVEAVSSITKIIDGLERFNYKGAYDWLNDEKNVADLEHLFGTANS